MRQRLQLSAVLLSSPDRQTVMPPRSLIDRREALLRLSALSYAGMSHLLPHRVFAKEDIPTDVGSPMQQLVQGSTRFAFELYHQLREEPGNLFFSPYSISTALAMTRAGARNETARQIDAALHFPQNLDSAAAELVWELQGEQLERTYELYVSNSLWGQRGYRFEPRFLEILSDAYASLLNEADFADEPDAVRREINRWVENQTNGKIEDLIPPKLITTLTTLVLVNALYFKASWKRPFQKTMTTEEPFHVSGDKVVEAAMMRQQKRHRYAAGEGYAAVEIPYEENELSMLIVLPDPDSDLSQVEASLNVRELTRLVSSLEMKQVDLKLPRFSVTSAFDLAGVLSALGMPDAFKLGVADFTGITRVDDLAISNVVHKAYVDVDEAGTEAAAATAVIFERSARPQPQVQFHADRPFLFLIRDHATESVLFMGRVVNPNA